MLWKETVKESISVESTAGAGLQPEHGIKISFRCILQESHFQFAYRT